MTNLGDTCSVVTTANIRVQSESFYIAERSDPSKNLYFFGYRIAITNEGGVRQDLPQGELLLRDVRSVLPFNNYLLVVELSFDQLRRTLENPQAVVSGMSFTYRMRKDGTRRVESLLSNDGRALDRSKRYKVIINDFMYRGGDHFSFRDYDPEPEETAIDWREPVLRQGAGPRRGPRRRASCGLGAVAIAPRCPRTPRWSRQASKRVRPASSTPSLAATRPSPWTTDRASWSASWASGAVRTASGALAKRSASCPIR